MMKTHLNPKQVNEIFAEQEDVYLAIQETYKKHFARNKLFRLVRCTNITRDITEELEQDALIEKALTIAE